MSRMVVLLLAVVAPPVAAQAGLSPADRTLALDILRQLVEIVTTDSAGNTPQAAQAMADRLIAAGFPAADVRVLAVTPRVGTLVARLRGTDPALRPILLLAHLDVVPARPEDWSVDPWTLLERDGWFYGRGTSDNKAGAAMLVANLVRYQQEGWRPERDVIVALTGDEETSGASIAGLLAQHRELVDAEFALNSDAGGITLKAGRPTVFEVQASEKVYADYGLEATDRGGHSSLPRPGNPIYTLAAALGRIAHHEFPAHLDDVVRAFFERSAQIESGQLAADMRAVARVPPDSGALARISASPVYNAQLRTTCVATRADAGHADNALPQRARAVVNCRILPGESAADVAATLRSLAGDSVRLTVLSPPSEGPSSPPTALVIGTLERVARDQWPGIPVVPTMETGATDGRSVRRAGIPTYGVSALAGDPDDVRAHGMDERVRVQAYYDATQFWYSMIKAFAGRRSGR